MLKVPLRKPLLGLRVELGDLFPAQPTSDISELLDILTKKHEYKVGRLKIGGGGKDNPEQLSQAAHFLLSHHLLFSLLAAHNKNGVFLLISINSFA